MDRTTIIYNNKMSNKTIKKANKSKNKWIKKFGDDSNTNYCLNFEEISSLGEIKPMMIKFGSENQKFENNPLIVGNIRMGFGHYRISIAMASCARALGYTPYWLDLASFDATGSKMIRAQNDMYSLASRISQKSHLFNHFIWEPLNCEGFKKISYNAVDQKNSELLAPIFKNIDKDIPYIATHVWPSQGAIHSGMTHVCNAVPDNWPMALHLSEGAVHAVQTNYAYNGYKTLKGFDKTQLKHMPDDAIYNVGCFVDHELLVNLEQDNLRRLDRINSNKPLRILMSVGGAGAGYTQFKEMIIHLIPYVKNKQVSLFINFGDHDAVYKKLISDIKELEITTIFDDYDSVKKLNNELINNDKFGIYALCDEDIFKAVYTTNLLMPNMDLLITKPGELAYYPIPKLFMKHIGGHEVYGQIHSREYGDGFEEEASKKGMNDALDAIISDKALLINMINVINKNKKEGYYDGAYKCVKLAAGERLD